MEDTPSDAFRKLQELLEQMIRDSMEHGNVNVRPVGFTLVIRGTGTMPGFPPGQENGGAPSPRVEVHEGDNEVLILGELPGITLDQVRLDLEGGILRIVASDGEREFAGRAEIPPVDPASMATGMRNGVLEVRFRRIPEIPG
ncbi:MAG TPA: Hsp20/alpha crystallin family protein [Methanomicrobiales archaeon]|jgi:HSP20 family protein|nr:Hsp20/alpha crystallin family protein [Methanomicrobiales archaeon]